jgi:tRNA-Thr(GGU) m(6)t(6)A37 methyltransferase TsaA
MEINLKPIAWVKNIRDNPVDDHWGEIISEITLDEKIPAAAFDHISDFSHLEVIYFFDRTNSDNIFYKRRPRGNPNYPEVGIFSQRNKDRPNQLGLCTVELIWHRERSIGVKWLDAINGTPVLDIKPVFREFNHGFETNQPAWVSDLLKDYF